MSRLSLLTLLVSLAAALPAGAQTATKRPIGEVQNGVYHHNRTGIEFSVPSDWVVVRQGHASEGAQTVWLKDTVTNAIGTAWMKARAIDPANTPAMMERRLDVKVAQRNNFEGYKFRTDSVQKTTIGGKPALSAVADYTRTGEQMVE